MKQIIIFIAFLGFTIQPAFAQKSKTVTETIAVSGNCNMCKKAIENAAYIKGVKRADWNDKTDSLTVTYRTSKTSIETIAQKVADAGYDANGLKASDEAYKKLPACCAYRDGVECAH